VKKAALSIILSIILLLSSGAFASSEGDIYWNLAVVRMEKNNNTLLNMIGSEHIAKRQYDEAVTDAKYINPDGMTITLFGEKHYIKFEQETKMYLTLQKELSPEQMKLSWEMEKAKGTITRNSMTIGLRNLYLGLYSADNNRKLAQKKYELAQNIYKQDKIRLERGLISDIDFLVSEHNLIKAEKAVDAAERNYENMLRSFNSFIGVELETKYNNIIYDEKFDESKLKPCEEYVKKALKIRLEITGIEKQLSLLERQKSIMDRFPKMLSIPTIREDYDDILLQIDILSLGLESARLNTAKEIEEAYVEVDAVKKHVLNIKNMLDIQKNNLDNMKKRYESGMVSKNMLDQAQISYDEMENNYKALLFDYNTKLMKLEYAAGVGPGYQEG